MTVVFKVRQTDAEGIQVIFNAFKFDGKVLVILGIFHDADAVVYRHIAVTDNGTPEVVAVTGGKETFSGIGFGSGF
ncbi:MAG TPA: hypothetical protein DCY75_06900, partial [Clostridiales bacterium]|nr:hypothetical protein [Clostridiales bacterium]